MKYTAKLWLSMMLLLTSAIAMGTDFKPFDGQSRAAIEQAYAGKPLILAFWSVDCTYCMEDLTALGELVKRHPQATLITVCTDGREAADKAAGMLEAAKLQAHPRWQFAEVDEERLRYNIDKNWYGELPRTYFYDAGHQVQAISGRPEKAWLARWIKNLR
ncbi:MAG: TlpA family protein disulfide reductase [Methylophilaceae bacterium]